VILSALERARFCCPEDAVEDLYILIELLKRYSASSDFLIDRVISYTSINEAIEILSFIARDYHVPTRKLTPLSSEQLSFMRIMSGEFTLSHNVSSIIFLGEFASLTPEWVQRVLLKPNMTSNMVVAKYQNAIYASELESSRFQNYLDNSKELDIEYSWLRNFIGSRLVIAGQRTSFDEYIGRGFDLNAKIALFNGILNKRITSKVLADIENPYHDIAGQKASIDKENMRACFDGPIEDERYVRCLYMISR